MGVEQLDTMKCSIAGRPYSIDNATLDSGAEGIGTIFSGRAKTELLADIPT